MVVLVYVDDILITGDDIQLIQDTKSTLQQRFKIKDLGELRFFLGIEFARSKEGILMHQRKYTLDLIADTGLSGSKPVGFPLETNLKLTIVEFDAHVGDTTDKILVDPGPYQRLLGRLLYLTATRPDISFAGQSLSQFMHCPKVSHMEAALRVVRYLKSCPGLGILLKAECSVFVCLL